MNGMKMAEPWRATTVLLLGAVVVGAVGIVLGGRGAGEDASAEAEPVQTVHLSDLSWDWATTGWVALADDNLPRLDASFLNGVIAVGGSSLELREVEPALAVRRISDFDDERGGFLAVGEEAGYLGLGQAEGEQLSVEERDVFGDVNKIRMFTMDIYRLVYEEAIKAKKDVYIESGWAIPNIANPYAHTFRYGDEFPEFEHRYPHGGLLEHVDYASPQKRVMGQRPNMGMVWGGPESQRLVRQWFEAALAMGTQMYVPSPTGVRLDGKELERSARLSPGSNYWYDEETGILRVRYRHNRPHTIEVDY